MKTKFTKEFIAEQRYIITKSVTEVNMLCDGSKKWKMSVPVNSDRDSDEIINAGLLVGRSALDEIELLQAELKKYKRVKVVESEDR